MEITTADPATYEQLVDMQLVRTPAQPRQAAMWLLGAPNSYDYLDVRVATEGAEILGWGYAARPVMVPPMLSVLSITVASAHERQGVGTALLDALTAALPESIMVLTGEINDEDADSLDVAKAHGFQPAMHGIYAELALTDLPEPQAAPGVTFEDISGGEIADAGAVEEMLRLSQTNPEAEAGLLLDLDSVRSLSVERYLAVLARVEGAPAAIIAGDIHAGVLTIGYTGVAPAFRGRELAFSLKQYAHRQAAQLGAVSSFTCNEESNAGIRHVNAQLGYRPIAGAYRVGRLRDPDAGWAPS